LVSKLEIQYIACNAKKAILGLYIFLWIDILNLVYFYEKLNIA